LPRKIKIFEPFTKRALKNLILVRRGEGQREEREREGE
jgi:hypothetical protein